MHKLSSFGLALAFLSSASLQAADRYWTGEGSAAGRFDSVGNYTGSGSLSGDHLIFDTAKDTGALFNDNSGGFNFHSLSITANASGFNLTGYYLLFKGKIDVAANTQATIATDLYIYTDNITYPTRELNVGANGTLTLDGYYGFYQTPVYKKGAGTLVINKGNKGFGETSLRNTELAVHHFQEGTILLGDEAILQRTNGTGATLPVFLGTSTSTAKLTGGGSIRGILTTAGVERSIIEVGGDGSLAIATINASAGLTLNFDLELGSHLLSGVGSFTAGDVAFNFTGGEAATTYTLLNYASYSVDLANFTLASPQYTLDQSFGTGGWQIVGNDLQVRFEAVPEPTALALLSAGAFLGLALRRRSR